MTGYRLQIRKESLGDCRNLNNDGLSNIKPLHRLMKTGLQIIPCMRIKNGVLLSTIF